MDLNNISINNSYIARQLSQQNLVRKMNPLLAAHFGVIWERVIQAAKRTLLIFLWSQQLKAELFQTNVTNGRHPKLPPHNLRFFCFFWQQRRKSPDTQPFLSWRPHLPFAPVKVELKIFKKKDFKYTRAFVLQKISVKHFKDSKLQN